MKSKELLKQEMGTAPRMEAVIQNQFVLFQLLCDVRELLVRGPTSRDTVKVDLGESSFKKELTKLMKKAIPKEKPEDLDSPI